jgi:hypothetical protein
MRQPVSDRLGDLRFGRDGAAEGDDVITPASPMRKRSSFERQTARSRIVHSDRLASLIRDRSFHGKARVLPSARCRTLAGSDAMLVASRKAGFGAWTINRSSTAWTDSASMGAGASPPIGTRLPLGMDSDNPSHGAPARPYRARAHVGSRIALVDASVSPADYRKG